MERPHEILALLQVDRDLATNIDSSLDSVESILGAVLDISRLDTGAMKPRFSVVALDELFRRIETDFAPVAAAGNLRFKVMKTSLVVRTDPNLLRRLIQNLVSNALKYTKSGGVVVGARRRGKDVEIQVVDTGIGIPSSKFRTVFKEFARLEEGMRTASGLGLGLSIVDRMARVLNHRVSLSSVSGRGTDFRVTVPMEKASRVAIAEKIGGHDMRPMTSLGGLRVLVLDNEKRITEGMITLLTGWGCSVTGLHSIADIDALSPTHPAPDALIVD